MISTINKIKTINNNNYITFQGILIRGYVSDNFKKFSKDKDKRKFYGQEYEKRQQQQQEEERNIPEWEKESKFENINFNFQNVQFQPSTSFSPFKIITSILGTIIKNKLFPKDDYKDLYQFACSVLQDNKKLIKEATGLPYINVDSPTVLFSPTIPGLSEVAMILKLPTPPTVDETRHVEINAVAYGNRLPDIVVQKSFPWNLFGDGTETLLSAEPTRVVLMVSINSINVFGQIENEKKEIDLWVSEYEIIDPSNQYNPYNNNNKKHSDFKNQEVITLDPKYYHEVDKNKK
ncbi:hypothetical protein ACTA71_011233 [Dictyostelium dimigraforme]